jgi:ATP-dependent Zn protease
MKMERREKSAFHEAGHVVSHFAYCWKVTGANIREQVIDGVQVCGQTFAAHPRDLSVEDIMRSDIVCTLAGPLSGQRAAGEKAGSIKDVDFHDDAERVMARVMQITTNGMDAKAIVQSCRDQAEDFIVLQWSAIEAVAKAMLEKDALTEAEITEICKRTLVDPRAADGEFVDPTAYGNVRALTAEEFEAERKKREEKKSEPDPSQA